MRRGYLALSAPDVDGDGYCEAPPSASDPPSVLATGKATRAGRMAHFFGKRSSRVRPSTKGNRNVPWGTIDGGVLPGGLRGRSWARDFGGYLFRFVLRRPRVVAGCLVLHFLAIFLIIGVPDFQQRRYIPGSTYRGEEAYQLFRSYMENDTDVTSLSSPWWLHPKKGKELKPCLDMPPWHEPPSAASNNGYIYIVVNGGLNQQRASICNAVTVARFLNATLVIPYFHYNAIWKDSSTFEELFDMEHFINSLKNDVNVVTSPPEQLVKALPEAVQGSEGPETLGYKVKILGRSPISAYLDEALPALKQYKVIRFSPYAKRLNNDGIPLELQRLRCKANFEAIRFAKPIRDMADILMERLLSGEYSPEGMRHPVQKYVSVHLRFEKDMVAFSNCLYTGKRKEKQDLAAYREYGWRGKFTRKGRVPLDPGKVRREGRCPLTPLEVGLVLRGMGFPKSTRIYIASGKIYGGEKTMQPLREMFPDILTKEMLLASEELAPFRSFSSRLAALDYTVCLHSEAFFVTQGGNFGEVLMGHRRFLNQGHAKTIKPDKKVLSALLDCPDITWDKFRQAMRIMRKDNDAKGAASRRIKDSIFAFPSPECMCPATYDAAAAAAAGLYKTAESLQPGSGGGEVSIDVGAIFPRNCSSKVTV